MILLKGVVLLYISQVLALYIVDPKVKLPLFILDIFFNVSFTDYEEGKSLTNKSPKFHILIVLFVNQIVLPTISWEKALQLQRKYPWKMLDYWDKKRLKKDLNFLCP